RRFRGRDSQPAPAIRGGNLDRSGGARAVPRASALRRLRGPAAPAGEPRRPREGPSRRGVRDAADRRRAADDRVARIVRPRAADRRPRGPGDPGSAALSRRRRRRLPDAGAERGDTVGRRRAAYSPGDADWLAADGRAVRARRAVDWTPSAG